MNCRTFQKNLEDYLENDLDFAGRFGMERHAQQCIHCGKQMADAQNLSRLVHELDRVKAPVGFESSVLNEIGKRKLRRPFSAFRRMLVFGFDMQPWQRYAVAASSLVVLTLGALYWYNLRSPDPSRDPALASDNPVEPQMAAPNEGSFSVAADPAATAQNPGFDPNSRFSTAREGFYLNYQASESDYGDYTAIGPDDLPMIVPLPNKIHMQVGLPSEEYYITNVSH